MFANRAVDSVMRGGVDENVIVPRTQTKTPHRTPKQQRRAFGDISNRKQPGTFDVKARTTPHHSIIKSTIPTKKVSFAAAPAIQHEPTQPEVEVSAGRVWRDQHPQDDEEDIRSIQEEMQAWNDEMREFNREERTRPLRIRQHRNAVAEKELEKRMEAVWGQDDEDLAAEMERMLVSVKSFDDISLDLDDDTFGPYSFPDDISF